MIHGPTPHQPSSHRARRSAEKSGPTSLPDENVLQFQNAIRSPPRARTILDQDETAYRKARLPVGFERRVDGIWCKTDGDGGGAIRVCGQIYFVAQTRDASSESWGILLEWEDNDGRQHRWAMPKALLAGDGGEIREALLSRGCYISPARSGRAKVMELLASVVVDGRARAVEKVGWSDEAFVLPDRTIGDTPGHRVIFQSASDASDHVYRHKGDLAQWQSWVARYAVGNTRLLLVISLAFAGPLLGIVGEEGGGINLVGASSIGKSTALVASGSVWGAPNDFVRQWRATSNALEGVCVQHNETLLCLDELAQLDPKEAHSVAYMIANGKGKSRAARSGLLRSTAQWKVMFLSSGEISLGDLAGRDARGSRRSAAGQEVRILDCEGDAGKGHGLFDTLLDAPGGEALSRLIKQGAAEAYGVAGPVFVERIIADRDGTASALKSEMDAFVSEHVPEGADGQVSRAARRFALAAAAGELAVRFGILPWPDGEASAACARMFQQWLIGRGGAGAAEDREAIAKVRGFLEMHGGSRFEDVNECNDARIINRAGFWRESEGVREFLFLPETWKNEVCAGMNASRVAKVLAHHGLLRQDAAGKNSISVTLPAGIKKTRCYAISAAIFDWGLP